MLVVALISAQTIQSIHLLNLRFMRSSPNEAKFRFPEHIKQSQHSPIGHSETDHHPIDPALCDIAHLKEYIKRTRPLRDAKTKLFISYVKPHKQVSKDTIGRWICTVMVNAAIDV